MPLIGTDYFVGRGEGGGISLSNSKVAGSLLRIARSNDDLQSLDTTDEYHLFAMFKAEDRYYLAVGVPRETRVSEFFKDDSGQVVPGTEYPSKMSFCFGQISQGEAKTWHGMQTRVLEIDSDEEPSCALGPFQIVRFQ